MIHKEVIIGIFIVIFMINVILIGVAKSNASEASTIDSGDSVFVKITFEGHDYLALAFKHNGHFVHSESCPCKKGNIK